MVPTKRTRRPCALVSTTLSHSSSVMPSAAQRSRSAGQASSSSRPSNSWLPATKSTGTGQPAKALVARPSWLSMSPASTSSSAPGAGSGSKASVSRCRSDSSCRRISAPALVQRAAVALLVLLAAAAGAGIVAADLGRVAAHGVDVVARVVRQVGQVGDGGHQVLDRVVERGQRELAVEHGDQLALFVGLGRQVAVQARQRRRHRRRRRVRAGRGSCAQASWKPATQGSSARETGDSAPRLVVDSAGGRSVRVARGSAGRTSRLRASRGSAPQCRRSDQRCARARAKPGRALGQRRAPRRRTPAAAMPRARSASAAPARRTGSRRASPHPAASSGSGVAASRSSSSSNSASLRSTRGAAGRRPARGCRPCSGGQARLDPRLGRRQLGRQVVGQLLEQLVVQRELGAPGRGVDARDLLELRRAEVQAVPVQVLVARADAEGVLGAVGACLRRGR